MMSQLKGGRGICLEIKNKVLSKCAGAVSSALSAAAELVSQINQTSIDLRTKPGARVGQI